MSDEQEPTTVPPNGNAVVQHEKPTSLPAAQQQIDDLRGAPLPAREAVTTRQRATIAAAAGRVGGGWAQNLERETAIAIAMWALLRDVDPQTEMDVLGSRPIVNGRWWTRKLAELIAAGKVSNVEEVNIARDARLDELEAAGDSWAREENDLRRRERILLGCPDEAEGAWVVRVWLPQLKAPLKGCQWAGGGTGRKIGSGGVVKQGESADPIGEAFAVEASLTRAYGKALRLCAPYLPALREAIASVDNADLPQNLIRDDRKKLDAQIAEHGKHTEMRYPGPAEMQADSEKKLAERQKRIDADPRSKTACPYCQQQPAAAGGRCQRRVEDGVQLHCDGKPMSEQAQGVTGSGPSEDE